MSTNYYNQYYNIKWLNKMVKKDKKNYMNPNEVYTFYIAYMDSFQVAIFQLVS